jgi:hypothetical protein
MTYGRIIIRGSRLTACALAETDFNSDKVLG